MRKLVSLCIVWFASVASPAVALQPLADFLAGAHKNNRQRSERLAMASLAEAELKGVRMKFLPAIGGKLGYTRNQEGVTANFPTTTSSGGAVMVDSKNATFVAEDQLDGEVSAKVPIVDVTLFHQHAARHRRWQAAKTEVQVTENDVAQAVTKAYHEYVAASAMVDAAKAALKVAAVNRDLVRIQVGAGTAAEIDARRADTAVYVAQQATAEAELGRQAAIRQLRTLTGIAPTAGLPVMEDDLRPEAPLKHWMEGLSEVPRVAAATQNAAAASAAAAPLWYVALPTIEGVAKERITNAPGFLPKSFWSVGATATWDFDIARFPVLRAAQANAAITRARSDLARDASRDAIEEAWQQIEALRARCQATQAQADTTALAQRIATADFDAGRVTALTLIEASRDAFDAEVDRLRSLAELQMWRIFLRLAAGYSPKGETATQRRQSSSSTTEPLGAASTTPPSTKDDRR